MGKLVYDGKSVYEIDEDCLRKRKNGNGRRRWSGREKNLRRIRTGGVDASGS